MPEQLYTKTASQLFICVLLRCLEFPLANMWALTQITGLEFHDENLFIVAPSLSVLLSVDYKT